MMFDEGYSCFVAGCANFLNVQPAIKLIKPSRLVLSLDHLKPLGSGYRQQMHCTKHLFCGKCWECQALPLQDVTAAQASSALHLAKLVRRSNALLHL
jgi:hypothetical protein